MQTKENKEILITVRKQQHTQLLSTKIIFRTENKIAGKFQTI